MISAIPIPRLLEDLASDCAGEDAILAVDGRTLSYGELHAQVSRVAASLNGAGIGRNDRVAVVLPNGPEMAVTFLAVACTATCAPLNPAYRAEEFEFYLSDLGVKALILAAGTDTPAREAAVRLGVRVIELIPETGGPAGSFTLDLPGEPATTPDVAEPEDVALVLHTSGTTSRPKIVPLTHSNLVASAGHIRNSLALSPDDRCLNVMPLFHIHGLIGATLSTVAAGGSIVCTPGFQAPRFFDWLAEFQPTWYTAVPTMHQAILDRAQDNGNALSRVKLRFLRSSSAALAPQVMARLEDLFQAPVVESYGMTEAAHQMASNPLPPGGRKPGSVGLAAGPDVAVMDEAGKLLAAGEIGEVVIRGPNVTAGYENNPEANGGAFTNGWFRTGDQGYLDKEGYLFLTGRLKEIINRGGEKISPREIDEVLLDHPAVAQALAFALPDERLGEDIGAAVVLRSGEEATETAIREYAAGRLADFKVPRRIVILEEIPKGPTGKLQRIGLAKKLGLDQPGDKKTSLRAFAEPRTKTEDQICRIWCEILGVERVGIHDSFFELGGDSILASMFLARLEDAAGVKLTMIRLFEMPTVAAVADRVDDAVAADQKSQSAVIGRRPQGAP